MPAWHSRRLCAAHMRHGSNDDVSEAQGPAYQHDLKLDRRANRQLPGAEKIDPRGADIASDEGNRRLHGHSAGIPKAQRQVQRGARVFPMFRMYAYGVRRHTEETPRLRGTHERRQAKGKNAGRIRQRLWSHRRFASFRGWFGRPGFKWSCAFRRAHLVLRDATSLLLATAQQTDLPN